MVLKLFIKPIVWMGIICYGLFLPAGNLPKKPFILIPHFDKLVHFGLFFVLCLLLFIPFKKLRLNHLVYAPLIAVVLSGILETMQHIVSSSRSSSFYDFLANTAGVLASVIFFHFFISGTHLEKYF
jgi:VanZ family protein